MLHDFVQADLHHTHPFNPDSLGAGSSYLRRAHPPDKRTLKKKGQDHDSQDSVTR
jgi:hypothetical protein